MADDVRANVKSDGALSEPSTSSSNRPVLKVLAWVWSVFILIGAVGDLFNGQLVGFLLLSMIGLLALPPIWQKVRDKGHTTPIYGRAIFSVILFAIYAATLSADQSTGSVADAGDASGNAEVADPIAIRLAELQSTIASDAVSEMTRADFSETYNKLGQSQFDKANELATWAAVAAAESEACPSVDLVGISERATRENLQWYVDCGNSERFFIDQTQAEAMLAKYDPTSTPQDRASAERVAVAEPVSARWKNFDEAGIVSACDLLVKQQMLVPSTFSTGWSRWAIDKNDETGIVIIERDYKSENAYSQKINGRYRCTVDADEGELVGLSIREPDGWRTLK